MSTKTSIKAIRRASRLVPVLAISAILACPSVAIAQDEGTVEMTDYGTVTLTVKDTDLATVLEMLAIQSKKNIVASKGVSATVTANLYDVTFDEALDAILTVNGFRWEAVGNFVKIYTEPEWIEIENARRQMESRIFELEHLSAGDANEFIAPLLSEQGQSSARGDVERGYQPDLSNGGEDSYAFGAKIVVYDYTENLDAIGMLLDNLDTPPLQVLVESTILQTTLDEANAFGVDFSILGKIDFSDLTAPLFGVPDLITGNVQPEDNKARVLTSTVGGAQGPGGLKIGIVDDDISIFLRVLDEVSDSTVLARPKVMCLNRQRAEVLVGARVGYLSTTATDTTTTQTVEYLDTGVQLVFRPFISKNGMIRMELSPSVSEAVLRESTDVEGTIVTIPDELTNELTTNVRIQDGETLVLGGLFREATRITRRQVPLIGDIPILGAAFRGQDDSVDRSEIIFLITPSIIEDTILWANGDEAELFAEAARVGARIGLLPFSRDQLAANHNKDALAAYHAGDTEKALFHVNASLGLKPVQPEMVRFRESLTGVRESAHEESILQRVFDEELGYIGLFPTLENPTATPTSTAATNGQWSVGSTNDFLQSMGSSSSSNPFITSYDAPSYDQDDYTSNDPYASQNTGSSDEAVMYHLFGFWGAPYLYLSTEGEVESTAAVGQEGNSD
jgi:type IV pilus assembly protein PilQ